MPLPYSRICVSGCWWPMNTVRHAAALAGGFGALNTVKLGAAAERAA